MWKITIEGGIEIVEGMEINPDTSSPYNPYHVNFDTPLELTLRAPENKNVRILVVLNGEWIQYEVIDPRVTKVILPAMGYFSSGRIALSATDESVHVESAYLDSEYVTIYTIDGRIIAKDVSKEAIDNLSPGIYIVSGKKIIVK